MDSNTHPIPAPKGASSPTLQEVEAEKEQTRIQTRRVWWFGLGSMFTLVALSILVFLFYDVAPPDESALKPSAEEIRPPTKGANPLEAFFAALQASTLNEVNKLDQYTRQVAPGTEGKAREYIERQRGIFNAFDKLMAESDANDWRWPGWGEGPVENWSLDSASTAQTLAFALRLRARVALADGDWENALRIQTDIIQFGSRLQHIPGTLGHHISSMISQRNGESELENILTTAPVTGSRLATLQEQIATPDPSAARLQQVYRIEYLFYLETLHEIPGVFPLRQYHGNSYLEPLTPYLFKPGMSRVVRAANDLAVVTALDKGWEHGYRQQARLREEFEAKTDSEFRRWTSPNPVGSAYHLIYLEVTTSLLARALDALAVKRMTQLQLAIRRYELDHQKVPEKLSDLVPQYADQLPLDPFTDDVLRWEPATQVLYSVGLDLSDHGGKFEKPGRYRDLDLGMYYWWSPAAAKWREEERIKSLPPPPSPPRAKKTTGKPPRILPEVAPSPESRAP